MFAANPRDSLVPSKHFENLLHCWTIIGEEEKSHGEIEERQDDRDSADRSAVVVGCESFFAQAFFLRDGVVVKPRDADAVGDAEGEIVPSRAMPDADQDKHHE